MVYEVETIKRQAKLRSVGWSWVSLWAQAQPMANAYASLACDMTSASEVAIAAWGALQVLYAFAFAFAYVYLKFLSIIHRQIRWCLIVMIGQLLFDVWFSWVWAGLAINAYNHLAVGWVGSMKVVPRTNPDVCYNCFVSLWMVCTQTEPAIHIHQKPDDHWPTSAAEPSVQLDVESWIIYRRTSDSRTCHMAVSDSC